MKLLGAGLIWACLVLTGINIFTRLKKRVNLIQGILLMIEFFSSCIKYQMKPIHEIISEINTNTVLYNLAFITVCSDLLNEEVDFPDAWSFAVNSSKILLKKNERVKLISFGNCIGRTDTDSHDGIIKIYYDFFKDAEIRAKYEYEKYSTVAVTVCFLSGFALFILML